MLTLQCPQCKTPMDWEDTFRTYGGLEDEYYAEHQLWSCPNCNKDYAVLQKGKIINIEIENIQET